MDIVEMFVVAGGGFEPPLTANKTALVPFHYPAIMPPLLRRQKMVDRES